MASNMGRGRFRLRSAVHRDTRCPRCHQRIPKALKDRHLGDCKGEAGQQKPSDANG